MEKKQEVIIIKLTIPRDFWDKLMSKYPELKNVPKATAIRLLLSKLL